MVRNHLPNNGASHPRRPEFSLLFCVTHMFCNCWFVGLWLRSSIEKFPDLQTHIKVGCDVAALLLSVLSVAFVPMPRKWLHVGTCQFCSRAA